MNEFKKSHFEVATYLIKRGADVNACRTTGFTALHIAAGRGDCNMANLLLQNHADIEASHCSGFTFILHLF